MPASPTPKQLAAIKFALFLICLLPALRLLHGAFTDDLGANPPEFVSRFTGTWTFNFLLFSLCITPLRGITGLHWLLRLRRMLGLFCFFYASLHFLAFIGFDHLFDLNDIARDILKRPFISVGFAAFVVLIPLAVTSNAYFQRRLGGRSWQELHRSVYAVGLLACLHYFWLVKASALIYPLLYSVGFALLMLWRIRNRLQKAIQAAPKRPPQVQPVQFYPRRPK
jgi:sulfoxide reductase heme-binding subunit YedZ